MFDVECSMLAVGAKLCEVYSRSFHFSRFPPLTSQLHLSQTRVLLRDTNAMDKLTLEHLPKMMAIAD